MAAVERPLGRALGAKSHVTISLPHGFVIGYAPLTPDERFAMDTTYETPKLTNYGSIAKLTQAGTSFDGGGGGIISVAVEVGDVVDVVLGDPDGGWFNAGLHIFPGP